jgi:AAA domain
MLVTCRDGRSVLPRQGVAPLFGKPAALKSFVALDLALHCAAGRDWAERRTHQCPVIYLACEGAGGFLKRKTGFRLVHEDWPLALPFHLISTAPNLGGQKGDLTGLIEAIEKAGVKPGLIVIDTLAQTLGGAEENGAGMVTFPVERQRPRLAFWGARTLRASRRIGQGRAAAPARSFQHRRRR